MLKGLQKKKLEADKIEADALIIINSEDNT
jgi:hypothetical protein